MIIYHNQVKTNRNLKCAATQSKVIKLSEV